MSFEKTFCTFYLGDQYFGVEVKHVREVLRHQRLTHVPFAPNRIGGLINLRGEIITALNLRAMMDIPNRQESEEAMNLVIHTIDGPVSLLVDEIGDVVDVSESQFETHAKSSPDASDRYVTGSYKLKDRLLLAIGVEEITQAVA